MKRLLLLFVLFAFTPNITAQITVTTSLKRSINSGNFHPAKVYTKNQGVLDGYACVVSPGWTSILFVTDEPKNDQVTDKEWTVYGASEMTKVSFPDKVFYTIKPKGGLGLHMFQHKLHENASVSFYAGYNTAEELIAAGKKMIFVHVKGDDKANGILINFKKTHMAMPIKIARNLKKCKSLKDEIETEKYYKTVSDFIKLLDFFDENCMGDN